MPITNNPARPTPKTPMILMTLFSRRIPGHRAKISDQVVSPRGGDRRRHAEERSIAESCCGAQTSGGLSHCRPLIIVDNVPPESIRAAAHDIACRASEVNVPAVGTFAIN